MTLTTDQPAAFQCPNCRQLIAVEGKDIHLCTTRITIGRKSYVSREYVGYFNGLLIIGKPSYHEVEVDLDRHAYDFYSDTHTPEKAVEIALAMGEPEPAPPRDDGPADNWGGFRATTNDPAARRVSVGWDRKHHPDLSTIAAQVLAPLAHLNPALSAKGDYLTISTRDEIAPPADDHAIVCNLIDALNAVAVQLPARPDSITASLHIDDELYQVGHIGPPRVAPAVAESDLYLQVLEGKGPWPTPDPRPVAKVNWSSRPAATCPIPCGDLRTLYTQDPAIYRLRLAALSTSELEQQAHAYAAYHNRFSSTPVTVAGTLARFRRSVAIYRAQAALRPASDDSCTVLAELALTDPCALAEFLRAHTPVQRDQLAWRYAAWLSRHHGITVLPAYIASNWTALLGDTETDAGRAVGDAQRCAESGS